VHRVAWTVADLRGLDVPTADEVAVALALRSGEPLPADAVTSAASTTPDPSGAAR
jgi:magnesium chelatase family protein